MISLQNKIKYHSSAINEFLIKRSIKLVKKITSGEKFSMKCSALLLGNKIFLDKQMIENLCL